MEHIVELAIAFVGGAGLWGAIHTNFKKKTNGNGNGLNQFAAHLIEQNNVDLKQENSFLKREVRELEETNRALRNEIEELKKQ